MRLAALVLVLTSLIAPAIAEEYFGRFLTELHGTFMDEEEGRPRFRLDEPFAFEDPNGLSWTVPSGTIVDGASIPEWLWGVLGGPFDGDYLWASVVHDHYCDTKQRTAHDTHRNFFYGMRAKGLDEMKAKAMYLAVDTFGPQWILVAGAAKNLDLTDRVVLAAAKSKMAGIVRTLQWSDGEFIDFTEKGPVPATLENLEEQASFYREALASGTFLTQPAKMGVVSFWNERITDQYLATTFEPYKAVPFDVWFVSGTPPDGASIVLPATATPAEAADTWLAIDKLAGTVN